MINKSAIKIAYDSIKGDILKTPLIYSKKLSEISGAKVYLKMEHLQLTHSFKLRGVLTKLKSIDKKDFNKTFVAASTGNHAAAFGYVSDKFGFKGKLFLPKNFDEQKNPFIVKLTHTQPDCKVFWYLNTTYIATTTTIHELAIQQKKGAHILTVVDEFGNELTKYFTIL